MDLESFVSKALKDIASAIDGADKSATAPQAFGHSFHDKVEGLPPTIVQDHNGAIYSVVDFDIAVTVTKEGGAEAKISVVPALGGAFGGKLKSESVSRVRFSTIVRPKTIRG